MTNETRHTPAPWLRDGAFVYALGSHGHNRFSAALQRGEPEAGEERVPPAELEANARLIAAAPEMEALLRDLRPLANRMASGNKPRPQDVDAAYSLQDRIDALFRALSSIDQEKAP